MPLLGALWAEPTAQRGGSRPPRRRAQLLSCALHPALPASPWRSWLQRQEREWAPFCSRSGRCRRAGA
jgi:hypothetical protein